MRGKALSTKKIQRAKELKRQGVPYRDIANKLGISLGAIAANTKDIAAPTRATHKYSECVAQEELEQPQIITPPHRRPFKFELGVVRPKRQRTAEELREHYQQIDYYKEQALEQLKEFHRLLDEGTPAEAEVALEKQQEAFRKVNELLS
ncbi:hypothetical protein ES707_09857 [subsurface metagenome]